jgi:N-acetylglucosamine-6-phosphate deacetylase
LSARAIRNLHLFDGDALVADSWAVIDNQIVDFGVGDGWKMHAETAEDGAGGFITPKLFDTHVHGGNGFSNDNGQKSMTEVITFHAANGVGRTFLSLISAPVSELVALIQEAKALKHPDFAGLHLEGPFISHEFKGAHDPKVLHAPTDAELAQIVNASDGLVKSMTVAPELISDSQLRSLQEAGIAVCFGHSAANYEQASAFFAKGSKIMTHAFNGMAGIHHRAPGPVPAALEGDAFTELIADGVHVLPAAARLLNQEKVILVTDAMAATGMPDGDYNLGTMAVKVTKGVARTESGSIAGSTLLLKDAVRNYAEWTGSPMSALRAAITNPAIAYGMDAPSLSRGSTSWLLWNGRLEIQD